MTDEARKAYCREKMRAHRAALRADPVKWHAHLNDANAKKNARSAEKKHAAKLNHRRWKKALSPQKLAVLRERTRFYSKRWKKANVEKVKAMARSKSARARMNAYTKKRRANDPRYNLEVRARARILVALKKTPKAGTLTVLIGCTVPQLKRHLEGLFLPGMSWDNRNLWHIDHIRPCALFDLTDPAQQRCCFHYSNLQPLWAEDNLKKADSFVEATP